MQHLVLNQMKCVSCKLLSPIVFEEHLPDKTTALEWMNEFGIEDG